MWITTNHLGSLQKMTNTAGTVTEITDYHSFGNERLHTGTNSKRRYIGEEYDTTTGLSYLNARYYEGSRGQFISQDLVFWDPDRLGSEAYASFLNDPQTQNSYSYARNNPINRSDPTGLFNIKTGAVEKGDTLSQITSLLNNTNGTNYNVSQVAKLNNISNPDKITAGQTLIPNSKNPDITQSLQSIMASGLEDQSIRSVKGFVNGVKTNSKYDLKNTNSEFNTTNHEAFVFNAEKIRNDAPGNILFGYLGAAVSNDTRWLFQKALVPGAAAYQTLSNFKAGSFRVGDNPGDSMYVRQGVDLFNNR